MKNLKFILTGAAAGLLNGLFGAGGGMVVVQVDIALVYPAHK